MTDSIRTFIAIDLPSDVKEALSAFVERLKGMGLAGVRWVKPDGIHLTLKFLGEIPPSTVPLLLDAIESAAASHHSFTLGLGNLGVFPDPNNPRILWVGLSGDLSSLAELQASVEEQCLFLGFEPDRRRFTPHLTLGRVRRTLPGTERELVETALQEGANPGSIQWEVDEIHLIHSTLTPQGAVYRSLGAASLLDASSTASKLGATCCAATRNSPYSHAALRLSADNGASRLIWYRRKGQRL